MNRLAYIIGRTKKEEYLKTLVADPAGRLYTWVTRRMDATRFSLDAAKKAAEGLPFEVRVIRVRLFTSAEVANLPASDTSAASASFYESLPASGRRTAATAAQRYESILWGAINGLYGDVPSKLIDQAKFAIKNYSTDVALVGAVNYKEGIDTKGAKQ